MNAIYNSVRDMIVIRTVAGEIKVVKEKFFVGEGSQEGSSSIGIISSKQTGIYIVFFF